MASYTGFTILGLLMESGKSYSSKREMGSRYSRAGLRLGEPELLGDSSLGLPLLPPNEQLSSSQTGNRDFLHSSSALRLVL